MAQNFLPEIFDRPFRAFPSSWQNMLMSPWQNLLEDDLLSKQSSGNGVRIYEDNDHLHVEVPLPGLNLKDIEVNLNKGVLLIKGMAEEVEEDKKRKYYRSSQRKYSYSLVLPTQIDDKQEPQAIYEDGILNISLQLAKQGETKKITVKSSNK